MNGKLDIALAAAIGLLIGIFLGMHLAAAGERGFTAEAAEEIQRAEIIKRRPGADNGAVRPKADSPKTRDTLAAPRGKSPGRRMGGPGRAGPSPVVWPREQRGGGGTGRRRPSPRAVSPGPRMRAMPGARIRPHSVQVRFLPAASPSEPAGGASRRDESGRSGGGKAESPTAHAAERAAAPPTRADGRGTSSLAVRRARSNLSPLTCRFRVTAYEPSERSCGRWARAPMAARKTAGGWPLAHLIRSGTRFCAAPRSIAFGTMIEIPGYGAALVADRGGAIGPGRLDVFFPTLEEAIRWGVRDLDCEVRQ